MTVLLWIAFGLMTVPCSYSWLKIWANWNVYRRKLTSGSVFLGVAIQLFIITVLFFAALL